MKVLVAHHFYSSSSASGENAAVLSDMAMMKEAGHEVRVISTSSDDMTVSQLLKSGMGIRSRSAVRMLRKAVGSGWSPDVLHFHNLFPLITSSLVREAQRAGIGLVQTLHNYRRSCAAGTHLRDGRICEDCVGKTVPWPAVVHSCYRKSALQTVPVAVNQVLDREVLRQLNAYIVLTSFMKSRLMNDGIPPERIFVRPTYAADYGWSPPDVDGPLVFAGRISEEKGVFELVSAFNRCKQAGRRSLIIVGDGPALAQLKKHQSGDADVQFVGRKSPAEVRELFRRSSVVVAPSLWYEGFPTVVSEAYSLGRPVMAFDTANAKCYLMEGGWTSPAGSGGLAQTIDSVLADPSDVVDRSARARAIYETQMTRAASYSQLARAYDRAKGPSGTSF